jgi:uncharacterized protein involved in response to NO
MIIFALGFRPFFLLAGIFAVVLIGEWILAFVAGLGLANYYGAIGWHSHEMIFGFTGAVIAGFLLTAVRNWTEIPTAAGVRLAGLAALWCAGRVIPFTGGISQRWLIATVDLAFFPALAIALSVPLLRKKEKRNLIFLALLAGLFAANLLIHLEMNGYTRNTARAGIFLGLHLIVLLIVVMGGRVIPFFTERALQGFAPKRRLPMEWLSPLSVLAFLVTELLLPDSIAGGVLSALAAVSNGVRLIGWYTKRIWSVPLLWVLHVGYAWIVAGFLLKALGSFGVVPPQFTIHAFTVGGIGVLTLGMMARVSLGHTGRPLRISTSMTLAFILINLAAILRGIIPILFQQWLPPLVALSGSLWIAAFTIFLGIFTPVLTQSRANGRPG